LVIAKPHTIPRVTLVQMQLGTGVLTAWQIQPGNQASISPAHQPGGTTLPSGLTGLFTDLNSIIGSSGFVGQTGFGSNGANFFGNSGFQPGGGKHGGPPPGFNGGGGQDADGSDDDEKTGIENGTIIVGETDDTSPTDDTSLANANTTAPVNTGTDGSGGTTVDDNGVITLGTIEIVSFADNAHDLDAGASGGTSLPGGVGDEGPATGGPSDGESDLFEIAQGGLAIIGATIVLLDPASGEVAAAGALIAGAGGTAAVLHGIFGKMPASDGLIPASDGLRPASDGLRPSDDSNSPSTPHSFAQLAGTIATSGRQFVISGQAAYDKSAGWIFAALTDAKRGATQGSIADITVDLQIQGPRGENSFLLASGMSSVKTTAQRQTLRAVA